MAEQTNSRKSQSKRQLALHCFEKDEASVLVATDVAARGSDVTGAIHVVNEDLPQARATASPASPT